MNMGKAVLQGVSNQRSLIDVGIDPPWTLEISLNVKSSCLLVWEGHGRCCRQGRFCSTGEMCFSLLLCFMAVNSPVRLFAAAQCSDQRNPKCLLCSCHLLAGKTLIFTGLS